VSQSETDPLPPLDEYRGAYDVFKRLSEDAISRACAERGLACTHLRIGAIFSNDQVVLTRG
jgi:nucleoside-diphosphate-sugar epimerase